ncbi:MAG: nucleoside kinase [Paludibacteraceae bacterium]|nr:nucleoside kinase [Paludibacteraceae bacterium]MBQ2189715.1 nucleoside kinase [Paludibacteraceae bacterium]MBQ2519939.1 nucleoside kinase [Paludibacteraceae bacterium]MBQ4017881.1 nucleoside kinase [Paludibacteraceae bacterium]MBQ5379419.1 nucleoside kinase [Paludibacteraceae bacterium]
MIPENQRRVAYINEMIESGHAKELVADGEKYHTEQLSAIARDICSRAGVRVVLIAGPSSSGKTSTSHKLCLELLAQGKQPVALSLDNWYVNGELTPRDKNGKKDYESVYAIDLKQLEEDLKALIAGKEIALPTFNFAEERREYQGDTLQLEDDTIMVIEGIHALNPILTEHIDAACKYKVYAAPMSPVSLDGENWIPTYVHRLLRRMSRDLRTRGKSPQMTIASWQSVREGEEKWIEPFRSEADAQFDTSMIYELPAIRYTVETALQTVPAVAEEYKVAERLLYYLSFFEGLEASYIPRTSILREFIGGSQFNVG